MGGHELPGLEFDDQLSRAVSAPSKIKFNKTIKYQPGIQPIVEEKDEDIDDNDIRMMEVNTFVYFMDSLIDKDSANQNRMKRLSQHFEIIKKNMAHIVVLSKTMKNAEMFDKVGTFALEKDYCIGIDH